MKARLFLMALAVIAALQLMFWIGLQILREYPLGEPEPVRPPSRASGGPRPASPSAQASSDWTERMLDALTLPPGEERTRRSIELFLQWVAQRPAEALTWGEESLEGQIRDDGLAQGLALWAKSNPTAASRWIEGMVDEPRKEVLLRGLLKQWGATDGLSAALWLDKLNATPQVRTNAATELAKAWAATNPRDALEWSLLEYNKTGQGAAFGAAFESGTIGGNLDVTRDFVNQLPPGEARVFATGKFAGAWTATEPIAAFRWAITLPDPAESSSALANVMDTWSRSEPSKAADAISYIEDPIARAEATAVLMERWVVSDAVAASSWLDQQPAGEIKDNAIQRFSTAMFPHDPGMALTWAQAIQDENARMQAIVDLGGAWLGNDPVKAQAWLANSQLPGELVEAVVQMHQVQAGALQSAVITDENGNPAENVWTPPAPN